MPQRTLAWFHCFSGIAGDMALGCLVDAGAELDEVRTLLQRLPVGGWGLEAEPVLRAGVAATRIHVLAEEDGVVRTYAHISGIVDEARLPDRVRARAQAVFAAMAEVEGRLHRRPPGQVHFHELGGVDAIVDVVGTCAGLDLLGVDEVWASPVATGTGMVRTAHGMLPNPAPAVVSLLRGAPTYGRDVSVELVTPTGAAVLAALAVGYGPLPPMTIAATGFGAGSRDLDGLPNVTQVVVGEATGEGLVPGRDDGQPVVLLEVNVDDATCETIAHAVAALLEAGAHG
ncbi:MAG: LarC family nickel insertion protein, partial [Acidimicrobiia bacterium]|nr:LarC family nickel insertion protein [Acidimicrobiia bacterium]